MVCDIARGNMPQAPITTIQIARRPKADAVNMGMRCFLTGYLFSGTYRRPLTIKSGHSKTPRACVTPHIGSYSPTAVSGFNGQRPSACPCRKLLADRQQSVLLH